MANVLLVEDDRGIAEPLAAALGREGHQVVHVETGEEAIERVHAGLPDVVVLDVGLPGIDGIEVCRAIRLHAPALPVLMLTARAEEIDAVVGLDAGADDYVTKPFRLAELAARIRALLRRRGGASAGGSVRVDEPARRAWLGDEELGLSPREFDLLALLARHAGTVVTRERIMEEVWGPRWYGTPKTLDMHVSWLRRKLGAAPGEPGPIATVRGVGFRFDLD